jgi:N-methylhydantoinase A
VTQRLEPIDGSWVVGIDSGGTFTDFVAIETATGTIRTVKVPSTPAQPVKAVLGALDRSGLGDGIRRPR